ncbi:MAG: FAD-dependent oxidoreductase [Bacteroidia bacterium]|nr:FAD-dependent oxidoreductase [Bacteroidia bacterium]
MELSYWEQDTFLGSLDIAIIGSGIVGLSAALRARELAPQARIAVLERGVLPSGASTRNAGFACFGSMTELMADLAYMTEDQVFALVETRYRGLMRLRARIGDAALRYEPLGGYEVFRTADAQSWERCCDHLAYFNREMRRVLGLEEVYQVADDRIPETGMGGVAHLMLNTGEGQIHTGSMMAALIRQVQDAGISLYNGVVIDSLEEETHQVRLHTDQGWEIACGQVLVAVNGFAQRLMPELPVQPARNQVLVTDPIPGLRLRGAFHYDEGYVYFRNIGDRVLLGGARNLDLAGEMTDTFGFTEEIQAFLGQFLRETILPGHTPGIASRWSGIMGVGPEKSPILRRVSPHVTVAVRMGGMGVAIGSLVGDQGAELMLG